MQRDWWDGLWRYPTFRRTQRGLGAAWGLALVGEAAVRAVLTYALGPQAMVVVNNVVPYVVIAVMVFVSVTVGKRSRAAAQRRHGDAALPPAEVAAEPTGVAGRLTRSPRTGHPVTLLARPRTQEPGATPGRSRHCEPARPSTAPVSQKLPGVATFPYAGARTPGEEPEVPRIALLSTSDTDLLTARASGADYVVANPGRPGAHRRWRRPSSPPTWSSPASSARPATCATGSRRIRAFGKPMVVLGGEQAPDAALMEQSTVPIGTCAEAHRYLAQGGPENLRQLHAFLSDTVLLTGEGFEPPVEQPQWGALPRLPTWSLRGQSRQDRFADARDGRPASVRPRVAILFYRAQFTAGNTAYVSALADAIDEAGGVGRPRLRRLAARRARTT